MRDLNSTKYISHDKKYHQGSKLLQYQFKKIEKLLGF